MFKTKEEVSEYFSGDKLKCLLCGAEYKSLGTHLLKMHGMRVLEYKEKFGLPYSEGLVSKNTKKAMADALKTRIAEGDETLTQLEKVAHLGRHAKARRFPVFARKMMGERLTKHNIEDKTATREEMERFVMYLEENKIRPWKITGKETELGLICTSTFCRNQDKHKDLADRFKNVTKNIPNGRVGISKKEIIDQVYALREKGLTIKAIAAELKIGGNTVCRIIGGRGVWALTDLK
jgi:hypothetical protein